MMNNKKRVYIQWRVESIVGDHYGYCSSKKNYEYLSDGYIWCSYVLTDDELDMLVTWTSDPDRWLYNILNRDAITIAPDIPNDRWGVTGPAIPIDIYAPYNNYYCFPSPKHGLRHERKRVPKEAIYIMFERPNTNELYVNSLPLKRLLCKIRDTNSIVVSIFRAFGFPMDIIKLLLRYVWNI